MIPKKCDSCDLKDTEECPFKETLDSLEDLNDKIQKYA